MELLAAGAQEENSPLHHELLDLEKRLDWTLLKRIGEISVLDDALDNPEMRPLYLYSGGPSWDEGVALRRALLEAIGMKAEDAPPRYVFECGQD